MRIKVKYISSAVPVVLGMALLSLGRTVLITHAETNVEKELQETRQIESAILETHLALRAETNLVTQFLITGKLDDLPITYGAKEQEFAYHLDILHTLMTPQDSLANIRLISLERRHQQLGRLAKNIFEQTNIGDSRMRQYLITLETYQAENDIYLSELFESSDQWHQALEQSVQQLQHKTRLLEAISLGLILLLLLWQYRWLFMPLFQAVESLEAGATSIGQGNLHHRLSVTTNDELSHLAHTFNTMAQQLEDSYANLESTVTHRTQALKTTNQSLEQEISDRIKTETQLTATLKKLQQTQAQLIHTEKMSSLGQLVAGVAHEINNPASFIAGNLDPAEDYAHSLLQLLQRYQAECTNPSRDLQKEITAANLEFIAADYPKLLNSMRTGVNRIQRIVESLRTFSCLDSAPRKQVNLHNHLDNTLMLLEGRLQGPRLHITVLKEYGHIPLIGCYPSHLNQVFMHLLTNAIDAFTLSDHQCCNQKPTITVRTQTVTAPLGNPTGPAKNGTLPQVLITIADNGPGIPKELKSRIFDPFFSSKPVGMGTGLGLSTGHQIVTTLHGGHLECRDVPGGGAAFDIYLPFTL